MRPAILFAFTVFGVAQTLPPPATFKVDFAKDVRPILSQKCHSCHGSKVQHAGLRLDRRQLALRGGDYGPVVVVGNSSGSKLIRKLVTGDGGAQMPPTGPLTAEEIGILRAWIDQGADFRIEVSDEAPEKPVNPKLATVIAAIRSSDIRTLVKLIAANPKIVNAGDAGGSTPLHHAAGFASPATMKVLLDHGADINAVNRRKSTPLFWAIHEERKVRLLLDRGTNVNAKTVDGRTPVYQAANIGDGASIMRLLLANGAAPDVKTVTGSTPLMIASRRGNIEVIRLLLEKGVDVNARSNAGATALMAASATGNPELVRLLLDKGADVNAKTKRGETALADAATAGNEETAKLLLDRGAEVNTQDIRGYSPLLYAAGSDSIPTAVVRMLLAKGADINARGDDETAAMLASKRGDSELAQFLGRPATDRSQRNAAPPTEESRRERQIAEAVGPALSLLEQQSHTFIRVGGCNSCHAQDLPSAAAALARERGLPAPNSIPQLPRHMEADTPERLMDLDTIGISGIGLTWQLFDLGMNKVLPNDYTDAIIHYVRATQTDQGIWNAGASKRPPMISGEQQAAALAIYSLRHYGRPQDKQDDARAIARAAAWLESSRPTATQDRAFRLLGLQWAQANRSVIRAAARELAAGQRDDGGWSQLPTMGSDAYATGEALYALHVGGKVPVSDAAYQKGVRYLLRTQAPDGSWYVKSRSIWLQPYFESGFPYGHDQWISGSATAWATMALSLTVEPPRSIRSSTKRRGQAIALTRD